MSNIEFYGHATYVLLAISYMVRDIFWLRLISIPASICSILFNYFAPAEPLWLIINWNLVFLALNAVQLWLIYRDGRSLKISHELAEFASLVSPRLSTSQALWLFRKGDLEDITGPATLLEEGELAEDLILILKGQVRISRNGMPLGACESGTILGEISFLTDEPHSASVSVVEGETTTILRWNQSRLKSFAKSRPGFHVALQQYLAANLSRRFTQRDPLPVG